MESRHESYIAGCACIFSDALPDGDAAAPAAADGPDWAKLSADRDANPDNLALKFFTEEYYNSLSAEEKPQLVRIAKSGVDNVDSIMGCYAMNPTDYDKFAGFFPKVLAGYHKVAEDAKHETNWSLEGAYLAEARQC